MAGVPSNRLAVRVLRRFRSMYPDPWSGSREELQERFQMLLDWLCDAYGVPRLRLVVRSTPMLERCLGYYSPAGRLVAMRKFSIITLLHEFRHHLDHVQGRPSPNSVELYRWASEAFFEVWPERRSMLVKVGEIYLARDRSRNVA